MTKKSTYKIYRCDAGKSRITVNNARDIFACSVMYGNNDYRIGSIYSGINKESQSKFECVTIESVTQCKSCEIKSVCGGECYVNAYLKNSDFYNPIDKMCKIKLELNKLSMSFVNKIKNKSSVVYSKLIDFAFEINSYKNTLPAVWAVMSFLNARNVIVNYSEVNNYIAKYDNIVEGILNYLKKFDDNISLYKIYNGKDMKTPAIAIINNTQSNALDFLHIVSINDGNVIFKVFALGNADVMSLPIYEFTRDVSCIVIC